MPASQDISRQSYFTWPMALTALRLLLLPVFLWTLLFSAGFWGRATAQRQELRWLAVGVFALMALTDKLDGYLARRFAQSTRLGAFLDPLADKLLVGCSLILLSFPWVAPSGHEVPVPVILAVYGKDLGVAIGALILLGVMGRLEIASCLSGRLSVMLQLALVMATLLSGQIARLNSALADWTLYILWWSVTIAAAAATVDYIVEGSQQYARFRRVNAAPAA